MNHIGTQYIETDHLILRRFELSDAPAMFANWASDDEVTRFLTWPTHTDEDCYRWAITLKDNGSQPIGSIDVCHWREDGEAPEIGYCMGKRWWHRGIMSEALGAVIDFLFDQVGVEWVVARHDVNNPHSGGVMRKCGMKFEEIREKNNRNNQGECDCACYAIHRSNR